MLEPQRHLTQIFFFNHYLSLQSQSTCRHQRLPAEHTGVVHQITSGDVVRTVRNDIVHEGSEIKELSQTQTYICQLNTPTIISCSAVTHESKKKWGGSRHKNKYIFTTGAMWGFVAGYCWISCRAFCGESCRWYGMHSTVEFNLQT